MQEMPEHVPPGPELQDASAHSNTTPVLRYSLKSLLVFVTVLCVLFALIGSSSFGGAIALVLAAVLVAAHVFGAVVGTRLRDSGTQAADLIEQKRADS